MLFRPTILEGIRDGRVTVAIRRWPRPRVRPGGRQRTAIGVVAFDAVEVVDRDALGERDARDAGLPSLDQLLAFVDGREGTIYRIRLRLAGEDPRVALREELPDGVALRELERRLERLDRASRHGPWTADVLRVIGEMPAVRAADLAGRFGRETRPFKIDVRKLKELGLTESLQVGYRLSPRGAAFVASRSAR
ncbi:MAG: hypothetical protein M3153_09510 [Chloroflexota bacterium]|nr:hypothetical protein [Chloroflexota bacterium]